MERCYTEWEKIYAYHMPDKELTSKLYEEFIKTKNPILFKVMG